MDGQKSLTRTQSSLLRSSPTVRSSIQSLSSLDELSDDIEEQKLHTPANPTRTCSTSTRIPLIITFSLLCFYTFFKKEERPTSENILITLTLIAILLFFINKNRNLVTQIVGLFKKLGKRKPNQVKWFIGDSLSSSASSSRLLDNGVECYRNGDYYEGEFHKGRSNGSGVYNYYVNGRYEGDWVDGRYDGYGIESWARGSRYVGQYKMGLRHGFGVYRFYTGDSYAGEWVNGQSWGVGLQRCADGSCYVGEFKCGVKHGLGCYHFRNGDRYAGEYFGDKIHGFGIYHFGNGHCYEGSWHEGRKQGYGMYTFRNGESRCGLWDSGTLKTSLPPLTDGVLRAVQAARKTAENAVHLQRVDEQVNKAVAGATKAATAARVAAVKAVQNQTSGQFCFTDL